jgi:hypothetical protein
MRAENVIGPSCKTSLGCAERATSCTSQPSNFTRALSLDPSIRSPDADTRATGSGTFV